MPIQKAVKSGAKLRLALYGPSGCGKTYTALSLAREISQKRVCVIDTERKSASKYADIFDFDVNNLTNYHPNGYIEAIKEVIQAKEYDVLIIDSTSHEWEGSRGALELAGQNFTNWASVTPLHNKFVDAMLVADIHVIATMRAKEEHVMEQEPGKKAVVRKMGMEPIQRKGVQYEFDIVGRLDMSNVLTIEKTRCSALKDQAYNPGDEKRLATTLQVWLEGEPMPERPVQLQPTTAPQSSQNGQQTAQSDEAGNSSAPEPITPRYKQLYFKGGKKKLWTTASGYCAFASAELGFNVVSDSLIQLTEEQLNQLEKAVDEEQPVEKAS